MPLLYLATSDDYFIGTSDGYLILIDADFNFDYPLTAEVYANVRTADVCPNIRTVVFDQ